MSLTAYDDAAGVVLADNFSDAIAVQVAIKAICTEAINLFGISENVMLDVEVFASFAASLLEVSNCSSHFQQRPFVYLFY
jgi:hypothetical protein